MGVCYLFYKQVIEKKSLSNLTWLITFQRSYYFFKPDQFIELIKFILSKPKVKLEIG
ncbi:hypothetical protein SEEM841_09994 [Salmonella enterica subsp. enterica serovar Senftenberg str. 423984-1]|nr:hypothetical protein SEEM841_09994 [Salmonella enterica subsp. enterica serovar Senftenberg str. 423984-1]